MFDPGDLSFWLWAVPAYLAMGLATMMVIAGKRGEIVGDLRKDYNSYSGDNNYIIDTTKSEDDERSFLDGVSNAAIPAWPFIILAYIVGRSGMFLWDGVTELKSYATERAETAAKRKRAVKLQGIYDDLWNQRNQLPWGETLNREDNRKLIWLEKHDDIISRPDERVRPEPKGAPRPKAGALLSSTSRDAGATTASRTANGGSGTSPEADPSLMLVRTIPASLAHTFSETEMALMKSKGLVFQHKEDGSIFIYQPVFVPAEEN